MHVHRLTIKKPFMVTRANIASLLRMLTFVFWNTTRYATVTLHTTLLLYYPPQSYALRILADKNLSICSA